MEEGMEYIEGIDEQIGVPAKRETPTNQIELILSELSPEEITQLRRDVNIQFDESLGWYCVLH